MSSYVRKPDPVQAVRLDPATGDITVNGTTIGAGSWLVIHADGRAEAVDDPTFTAGYDPAPTPPADAGPEEPAPAPNNPEGPHPG